MMKKISFEDALILSGVKLARLWVRWMPRSASSALAEVVGALVFRLSKRGRIAYKNLRMVYAQEKTSKELWTLAEDSIKSIAKSAVELLGIPETDAAFVSKNIDIVGEERILPLVASKQGFIFLTGHFGSWELMSIVGGLRGYPSVVLARVQKHPRSDQFLNQLRRAKGSPVVHKGYPIREILKALKDGRNVAILSDQDGGIGGRMVHFMGRLSSTPPGAAVFALRTECPIYPVFTTRLPGGRFCIEIEEPLAFPPRETPAIEAETDLLQQFSDRLEKRIRKNPEQWLWAHRRWKSSPDRRILVLSDGKAGHFNQSLALEGAIRRERKGHGKNVERLQTRVVDVQFKSRFRAGCLAVLNTLFQGHLPAQTFWVRWALKKDCFAQLAGFYADVVISCGSSLLPVNLWVKRENEAKSVVIMNPSLPYAHFDAVIAPRHDELESHPALFTTEGALSALKDEDLEVEGAALAEDFQLKIGGRRIGFLVGGDSGTVQFHPDVLASILTEIKDTASSNDAQLLVTTSRRTPAWAEARLKEIFSDRKRCPMLLIANEANRRNAVAGILGASDAVIVTGESMSMISEAISAGKPVLVVKPWPSRSEKRKYEIYLSRLAHQGRLVVCTPDEIRSCLERAFSGQWEISDAHKLIQEAALTGAARKVMS